MTPSVAINAEATADWIVLNFVGFLAIPLVCWLLSVLIYRARLRERGPKTVAPTVVLQLFEAFCRLTQKCYDTPSLGQISAVFEIHGWKFTLVEADGGGEVWLWLVEGPSETTKTTSGEVFGGKPAYVVVIRGSLSVHDWIVRNKKLAADVADKTENQYETVIDDYRKKVRALLLKNLQPGPKIVLAGHSLGASVAESLHVQMSRDNSFKSVGAVTFDSPGQPVQYRSTHGFTTEAVSRVWTLNSRPNIVNTVSTPCAKDHFYSCGLGRNLFLSDMWTIGRILFCGAVKEITSAIFARAFDSHKLTEILPHILDGKVVKEDSDSWPLYSGSTLTFLFGCVVKPSAPTSVNPAPSPPADPTNPTAIQLDSMTRAVPYVVPFETLKKLISQTKESDVIIPFIGSTGQGKTTTVGRLSNANLDTKLSGSPLEKHVGNAVNNSLLPILIYWRDRDSSSGGKIYLLDIPGFGGNLDSNFNAVVGKAMDGNSNNKLPYARVPTEDQLLVVLNSLGFVFPHIVIVVKDVIDDASAKYFEKLNTFNKDTKFHVAYNADLSIGIDHEYVGQRINHYKGVFKHVQDITFETYSAAKPHTFQLYKGYRIDHLEQSLVKLARLDSFKPYPKEIDFHLNAIPEGSGNDSPKSNTWGRFVRDLIPVVGPACNFVEHCKERKYGHAVLDATFVAVDGATLGFSAFARTSAIKGVYTVSQATRSIWTPVGRGAYNYVGKQGLNILRRTGVGLAEGATSALVRRVANKKKKG